MDAFFVVAFSTLFAIVNPFAALGPFLAMTVGESEGKRRAIAMRASIIAGGVLIVCALVGGFIFKFFGITLPALKIAGGILLFFVAFDMINARPSRTKQTAEEQSEGAHKEDIAVFPLAIPLISGPGSIVSVFMLADQANSWPKQIGLYLAILVTAFGVLVILSAAPRVVKYLGQIGMNVLTRLMGIVLAATSIQFIIDGIRAAIASM